MTSLKKYILGLDVGGTKVDAQLFEIEAGRLSDAPIWELKEATLKGLHAHTRQIVALVVAALDASKKRGGVLIGIGIGSPGRFDADGAIKPRSNPNMGLTQEEFDGVNLRERYALALAAEQLPFAPLPLCVMNDGSAMLAGMLEALRHGKITALIDQDGDPVSAPDLHGRYIGLFGIGTGIGHAIVTMDGQGRFAFVTDGHASKLRLPLDAEDMQDFEKAATLVGLENVIICEDGMVRSEDLFRGPIIQRLANITGGEMIDPDNEVHARALRFAGKYMAKLIAVIHEGCGQDIDPRHGWSKDDRAHAAKTSIYLVGGGMGSSATGKYIIQHAGAYLRKWGIGHIRLVQITRENIAARAAATLVFESELAIE